MRASAACPPATGVLLGLKAAVAGAGAAGAGAHRAARARHAAARRAGDRGVRRARVPARAVSRRSCWSPGSWGSLRPGARRGRHDPLQRPPRRRARRCGSPSSALVLWLVPLLAVAAALGPQSLWSRAVPVLHAGRAGHLRRCLRRARLRHPAPRAGPRLAHRQQSVAGLALAETTPGPLVIVLQFMGFMAGWNQPGAARAGDGRGAGRAARGMGHVPAVVRVHLPRARRTSSA